MRCRAAERPGPARPGPWLCCGNTGRRQRGVPPAARGRRRQRAAGSPGAGWRRIVLTGGSAAATAAGSAERGRGWPAGGDGNTAAGPGRSVQPRDALSGGGVGGRQATGELRAASRRFAAGVMSAVATRGFFPQLQYHQVSYTELPGPGLQALAAICAQAQRAVEAIPPVLLPVPEAP